MMTDKALLLLAALAPTAMSLIGIIFAKADLKDFKNDVQRQFGDVQRQFGDVQRQFGEMQRQFGEVQRQFDDVQRTHDSLARKMDDVMAVGHKDALEIMRQMTALHERVAVVEAKQGRSAA